MNEFNLMSLRENAGLTQQELADKIKVSRKTINTYENGGTIPEDKILLFKLFFNKATSSNTSEPNGVWVPYYDVDFSGGWVSSEITVEQKPSFFITSPEFERAEFACNLFGNSISNRIANRSVIGLREIFDWQTYFQTNEIYAVIMKNDLRTVKIVKRSKLKKDFLELLPDPKPEYNNTGYEKEDVPMSFVSKFYQVVAWAFFDRISM